MQFVARTKILEHLHHEKRHQNDAADGYLVGGGHAFPLGELDIIAS